MNAPLRKPWTQEQFLDWACRQEGRYEFDGFQPVAMTGDSADHMGIGFNVLAATRSRLRGNGCFSYGDLGIATVGQAVRYPDALISCSKFPGTALLAPNPHVVFEVVSTHSVRRDRIEKVREYAEVTSIRHYVMLEASSIGLTLLSRPSEADPWTIDTLTDGDTLKIPEIRLEIPVADFYLDIVFEPETDELR